MKLSEAEVVVTTQQQIEQASGKGNWFHLAEYGDTGEFYNACCLYFPEECNPLFRYPAWENIPDALINEQWFSPNFFEFRDAVERIDEEEIQLNYDRIKQDVKQIVIDEMERIKNDLGLQHLVKSE